MADSYDHEELLSIDSTGFAGYAALVTLEYEFATITPAKITVFWIICIILWPVCTTWSVNYFMHTHATPLPKS
jgi:hypothetical protein